ncbi:hypothetical protein G9A89_017529 [Geosiphon pyriformis]|nr:hypothetical protein G9A89_017529 [Geosiphon pyriformis]
MTRNFLPWELELCPIKITEHEPTITASYATENGMATQNNKTSGTTNYVLLVKNNYLMKKYEMTFLDEEKHITLYATISYLDSYSHDKNEIWQMVNAKVKGTMPSEILEIKNNSPEPVNIILISNSDVFFDIETDLKEFHEHY